MTDDYSFNQKPTPEETCFIQKRMKKQTITIHELADKAIHGFCFKSSYLKHNKKTSFVSSSLVVLDIDNCKVIQGEKIQTGCVTYHALLEQCEALSLSPSIIYSTYSDSIKCPHFRVVFQLSEPINNLLELEKIYTFFHFFFDYADKHVKSCSLIYPGKELLYFKPDAFVMPETLKNMTKIFKDNTTQTVDNTGITDSLGHTFEKATRLIFNNNKDKLGGFFNDTKKEALNLMLSSIRTFLESKNFVINATFDNYLAAKDCLHALPLYTMLDKNEKGFCCVFHEDQHPSANIYHNMETNTFYYKCFACNQHLDIFDLTCLAYNCSFGEAQKILFNCLQINVEEDEWKIVEYERMRYNRKILNHLDSYEKIFPKTVRSLMKAHLILRFLIDVNEESLNYVSIKNDKDLSLFQVSRSYIIKMCQLSDYQVRTRLDILLRTKIIEVLNDEEVKAYSSYYASKSRLSKDKCTISTYFINTLTYQQLSLCESLLNDFHMYGATVKGEGARQSFSLGNNIKKKSTVDVKRIDPVLLNWAKRTLLRKHYILKKDYLKYAKKQGFSEQYASSFIVLLMKHFHLLKKTVTKEMVLIYGLTSKDMRCTIFIKSEGD